MKVYRMRRAENYLDLTLDKSTSSEHPIETDFTGETKLSFWTPLSCLQIKKEEE